MEEDYAKPFHLSPYPIHRGNTLAYAMLVGSVFPEAEFVQLLMAELGR